MNNNKRTLRERWQIVCRNSEHIWRHFFSLFAVSLHGFHCINACKCGMFKPTVCCQHQLWPTNLQIHTPCVCVFFLFFCLISVSSMVLQPKIHVHTKNNCHRVNLVPWILNRWTNHGIDIKRWVNHEVKYADNQLVFCTQHFGCRKSAAMLCRVWIWRNVI